jgi:hypothetical protein
MDNSPFRFFARDLDSSLFGTVRAVAFPQENSTNNLIKVTGLPMLRNDFSIQAGGRR